MSLIAVRSSQRFKWGCAKAAEKASCGETVVQITKILVSVKFVSAILGPEMGAPILWTPGIMRSFCRKNHVRKIPFFFGGGGGGANFIFMGARIFLTKRCFWRVHFFSVPLRFSGVSRANLKAAEKKRALQKHPFGQPFLHTTPSPLLWRALNIL